MTNNKCHECGHERHKPNECKYVSVWYVAATFAAAVVAAVVIAVLVGAAAAAFAAVIAAAVVAAVVVAAVIAGAGLIIEMGRCKCEKSTPLEGTDKRGIKEVITMEDLEKQSLLDHFGINSFDCVVCLDVLEHVNDLHGLLQQIIRISKSHVVLSFPNELNWHLLVKMRHTREREFGFFPRNRHKWFISYEDSLHLIKCLPINIT